MKKVVNILLITVIVFTIFIFTFSIYNGFFSYKGKVNTKVCELIDGILLETDNTVRNAILSNTYYEVEVIDKEKCTISITSIDMEFCIQKIISEIEKIEMPDNEDQMEIMIQQVFDNVLENSTQVRTYEIELNYSYEDNDFILYTTSEFYDALFGGSFSTFESLLESER